MRQRWRVIMESGEGPRIAEMRITPIAVSDPPLRNAVGLHAPFALRTIIELVTEDDVSGVSEIPGDVDANAALYEYAYARRRPERFTTCPLKKLAPRVFGWRAERRHDAVRLELVFESLTRDADGNLTITVRDPSSTDRVTVVYADGEWRLADEQAAQPEPEQPAQQ